MSEITANDIDSARHKISMVNSTSKVCLQAVASAIMEARELLSREICLRHSLPVGKIDFRQ